MNTIKIITGEANSGKTYFAYHSLKDDIRLNNKVLTLDFYGSSMINGFVYAPNHTYMISDVDCIIRNLTSQIKKYNVIIFDGFEQLINTIYNEINHVNPNSPFFDIQTIKMMYIKTKIYEWITALLVSDYDIILVYNPSNFKTGDCKYIYDCFSRNFELEYYKTNTKVINYEIYFNQYGEQFVKKFNGLDKKDLKMEELIKLEKKS